MSMHVAAAGANGRKKVTIASLNALRVQRTPITVLTAYDYQTGLRCDHNHIDVTLVGDSLAQVCLGYDFTTRLTLSEMVHHTKAVSRGSRYPLLVADMPFGTYHASTEDAVRNAVRLVQEGGAEAVKLEGGEEIVPTIRALTKVGIPVMAHVGLLPQRHTAMSGFKVQGRDAGNAKLIYNAALALQDAGAFSMVLEAIPHRLASYITRKVSVPTIGIGAGPGCDGQVLVWDDAMGQWAGHKARFVRCFAELKQHADEGVKQYVDAVRARSFPDEKEEAYDLQDAEWEKFIDIVDK